MAKPNGAAQAETLLAVFKLIDKQTDDMINRLHAVAEVQGRIIAKTAALAEIAAATVGEVAEKRAS